MSCVSQVYVVKQGGEPTGSGIKQGRCVGILRWPLMAHNGRGLINEASAALLANWDRRPGRTRRV